MSRGSARRSRAAVALVALTTCFAASPRPSTRPTASRPRPTLASRTAPTSSSRPRHGGLRSRRALARARARPAASPAPSRCSTATPTSATTSRISTASTRAPSGTTHGSRIPWFAGGTAASCFAKLAHDTERHAPERGGRPRLPVARRRPLTLRLLDQRTRTTTTVRGSPTSASPRSSRPLPRTRTRSSTRAYLARVMHDPGIATLLVQTSGASPRAVGQQLRSPAGNRASVSDINTDRALIASSLTSVELQGLTRVELGYALVLIAASTGSCCGSASQIAAARSRSPTHSAHGRDSSAASSGRRRPS